jgi:hypothetical protein
MIIIQRIYRWQSFYVGTLSQICILQQFTSSSWITCGEGKDGVKQNTQSRASVKSTVGGVGEAIEVDGVLRGRRWQRAPGKADEVDGVLRGRRRQHAPGEAVEVNSVLWGWRQRRAPGKAVEATACSGGEAVEGALRRRWRAPGIGGVEDLKRVSGENLLNVERAARAPDIYIRGQMRDAHSLRHVAHFFRRVRLSNHFATFRCALGF